MSSVIYPQTPKNNRTPWVALGIVISLICCCTIICLSAFAFGAGNIKNLTTEVTPTEVIPTEVIPSSVIKITLTNQNCHPNDFYVDNQLTVSSIQPGADIVFSTTTGNHVVYACDAGTNNCAQKTSVTWSSTTTNFYLDPAADCKNST